MTAPVSATAYGDANPSVRLPAWGFVIFTARCYASAVLAMGLCLSVRLSVTSRSSTKMAERIELVFGMWASFHPSYTVLKEKSVISKNKGTSLWNFVLNSGLRKFRHGISIVVSGSGISWAICKSAYRSRQMTTPTPHHSVFSQAGCPSCHPTNSVKALKATAVTLPNLKRFFKKLSPADSLGNLQYGVNYISDHTLYMLPCENIRYQKLLRSRNEWNNLAWWTQTVQSHRNQRRLQPAPSLTALPIDGTDIRTDGRTDRYIILLVIITIIIII